MAKEGSRDKSNQATESELAILKSLWQEGPGTVRELDARILGRDWAYTTLQTLLARLESKGLVSVDRNQSAHRFSAAVSHDEFLSQRLSNLADEVCDGTSTPLVMALVEGAKFSADDIARFRQLLDKLDEQNSQTRSKRKGAK